MSIVQNYSLSVECLSVCLGVLWPHKLSYSAGIGHAAIFL